MEPDSNWILRELVAGHQHRSAGIPDTAQASAATLDTIRFGRVRALLERHAGGEVSLAVLKSLPAEQQQFIVHWVEVIARSDTELARLFARRAPQAFEHLEAAGVEAWLIQAMDAYDKRGLGYGVAVLEDLEGFARDYVARALEVRLEQQLAMLQPFVTGLGGRPLTIASAERAYTDSEVIYLPERTRRFHEPELNRRLLLVQVVYLWAQNYYGSWRLRSLERLSCLPDQKRSVALYAALERLRLEACLARDLPGLYRNLAHVKQVDAETRRPLSAAWRQAADRLATPGASEQDSLELVERLRNEPLPATPCYQGVMYPNRVRQVLRRRVADERDRLRQSLHEMQQQLRQTVTGGLQSAGADMTPDAPKPGGGFALAGGQTRAGGRRTPAQLEYEGRKIKTPAGVQGLLTSIEQDLGQVPDDYLVASGDTPYDANAKSPRNRQPVRESLDYAECALSYPEWDYNRQRFRRDYCLLREHTVKPGDLGFIYQTLQKYRGPLKSIRRSFEAIRGQDRLLRRQADGDEIDIDALIQTHADQMRGAEMDDRVYKRHCRVDRDIAVMIMVDMSGSTRGWINTAEREALVLLCEALETLGDHYAIYGFSGRTHTRCAVYHIKRFDEAYTRTVRERISGIRPQTYTRMGVAIRHLNGKLRTIPARTKLLVTLSDGKPEDYGSYRGRYGIEDTRRALIEARRDGTHAFCITIDREGGDYLPHMYGRAHYAVIDEVSQLPLKVADIYKRLTT